MAKAKVETMSRKSTTDFGYKEVGVKEKKNLVRDVFDSVASRYDLMNDLMSLGIHRCWKKFTIDQAGIRPGHKILDLAGGTGDLAAAFSKRVGESGLVVLADINHSMLEVGREKLLNAGMYQNLQFVQTDAEKLTFPDNYFDCITIAFGLRNVTDKNAALKSMYRVLRPGGKMMILEFSKPVVPGLKQVYDVYSFKILPRLGKWFANDAESYQYLVESIRMHPDQETLKKMMVEAGFDKTEYKNLTGGIVALHTGYKF
jgi:demethylmenaquinone methyltransferase/2-methoxy-6-polyprenyl-1,4-benzoquinol methylase